MRGKKLSAWAKEQGVHYRTALSWIRDGIFPHPFKRTPGGHIRIFEEGQTVPVRPSPGDQKVGLDGIIQVFIDLMISVYTPIYGVEIAKDRVKRALEAVSFEP